MSQASTGARPGEETTMGYGRCVGRVGALAIATRMTVSIGVAVLVVMSTVVPVSPAVRLAASSAPCTDTDVTCALIMGTSGVPTPDDFYVENVKNRFIAPTHPGQIDYVKVTTPEGFWPLAGVGRLVSLLGLGIGGSPEIFGPGGPAWDVPWWNLTGLFDLPRSVDPGRGRRSGGRDGGAPQRVSGDLRLLAERGHRQPGEAQAGRAVPGGNRGPRHRLRARRRSQSAQRGPFRPVPGPLHPDP